MPQGGPGTMPDLSNVSNSQIDQMTNMISTPGGKEMMRTMYKQQFGMDLGDAQLEMMASMMTPDMIKTGMNMQSKIRNQPQTQTQTQTLRDEQVIREAGQPGNNELGDTGNLVGP
jgi:hypothetical protein